MKRLLIKVFSVMIVLTFVVNACAWESYANGWDGTVDDYWSTAGNWSKGSVPGYSDGLVTQVAGGSSGFIVGAGTEGGFYKLQIATTTEGAAAAMVESGASLTGKWYVLLADGAGTEGSLTNSGTITVDDWIGVARHGTGSLVNNGTVDIANYLHIATYYDGNGSVANNGTITLGKDLRLAVSGTANFNNSGTLSVGEYLKIATSSTGTGNGTFTNTGIVTVGSDLLVGQYGTGVFNQDEGTLDVTGALSISDSTGYGTFNLSGGTVNISGASGLNIGGTAGALNIYDGLLDVDGQLSVLSDGAEFNLYGGQAIFETIEDSTFVTYGDIDITGGALYIAGDLLEDATLLGYISDGLIYTSTLDHCISLETVDIDGQIYTELIAVPEPATLALLSLGSFVFLRKRR